MNRKNRSAYPLLLAFAFSVALAAAPAVPAQVSESEASDSKSAKEQAREERIREYLRKKEERRAQRDAKRDGRELPPATAPRADVATSAGTDVEPARRARAESPRRSALPRDLARAQETVRRSAIGSDPTVQGYLDLVEVQEASPHQLAAFGNFLGQNGMNREALEYYRIAVGIEDSDPVLWVNLGTLHRQLGDLRPALGAYGRALDLDPSNALAHYNVGAILDQQGRYEDAIEAYTVALTLDPSLGDPTVNPQATNNERLLAVKLKLYGQSAGSAGLPLVEVSGGGLEPERKK